MLRIEPLLTIEEGDRLSAASFEFRSQHPARVASVAKPCALTLDECRAVRPPREEPKDRRGLGIDAPIRSDHGPFQASHDFKCRLLMSRTRKWRPRLLDDGRAARSSCQRNHSRSPGDGERESQSQETRCYSGRLPRPSIALPAWSTGSSRATIDDNEVACARGRSTFSPGL